MDALEKDSTKPSATGVVRCLMHHSPFLYTMLFPPGDITVIRFRYMYFQVSAHSKRAPKRVETTTVKTGAHAMYISGTEIAIAALLDLELLELLELDEPDAVEDAVAVTCPEPAVAVPVD